MLILFFVTPAISSSVKKSAMEFMIEIALENPDFYMMAFEEKVLVLKVKSSK